MKRIVQIVDSIDYIHGNCFQHQLAWALSESCELVQVTIREIVGGAPVLADGFISCLKQRTLLHHAIDVARWLDDAPLVVYDQDPWQAFMDDSPYKGTYERVAAALNVKTFALTTKWWVDFLKTKGLPSTFVRMWVLPQYCDAGAPYEEREFISGFVGTVHPRRRALINLVEGSGIPVHVGPNSLAYPQFLKELARLRVFIHNEDMPIYVDGEELNFNTGMWVKDIEAVSQGCFSIRNAGAGYMSYLEGLPQDSTGQRLVRMYEYPNEVPGIIEGIQKMDHVERQTLIEMTVEYIKQADMWHETAAALLSETDETLKV